MNSQTKSIPGTSPVLLTDEEKFATAASNIEIIGHIILMLIWGEFVDVSKRVTMYDMITISNGILDKFPILQLVDIPDGDQDSVDELPSIDKLTDIVRRSIVRIVDNREPRL